MTLFLSKEIKKTESGWDGVLHFFGLKLGSLEHKCTLPFINIQVQTSIYPAMAHNSKIAPRSGKMYHTSSKPSFSRCTMVYKYTNTNINQRL